MGSVKDRAGGVLGYVMFFCGLALIVAAPVLNIAYDRLAERAATTLPSFVVQAYEMSGKLGVTMLLVTAGLSIIIVGLVAQKGRPRRTSSQRVGRSTPYFPTPGPDTPLPEVSSSGTVILRTQKYLPGHASLSGLTGFPLPRRPEN